MFCLAFVCVAAVGPGSGKAVAQRLSAEESRSQQRTFVLDSGFFFDDYLPSPRAMGSFYRNYETLGLYAYDLMEEYVYRTAGEDVDPSSFWVGARRAGQLLIVPFGLIGSGLDTFISPANYLTTVGWETVHEYAHRTRGALSGFDHNFNPDVQPLGDKPFSYSLFLLSNNLETGMTTWKGAKGRALYPTPPGFAGKGSCQYNSKGGLIPRPCPSSAGSFIEAAAGINQQVNLALGYARRSSATGYLDVANFYSYYTNAASYFIYNDFLFAWIFGDRVDAVTHDPVGDRAEMIESWRKSGKDYDDKILARNQLISTALSGTTWSHILGSVDYIKTGERQAEVLRFKGIRLPDFYNYDNVEGPTLKIYSDYRIDDANLIPFAFEFVTDGKSSSEATLGYIRNVNLGQHENAMRAGADLLYNLDTGNVGVASELEIDFGEHVSIGGG